MKEYLLGIFALMLLVQIPFISAFYFDLNYTYCENVSEENYDTCEDIIDSDLRRREKLELIESLDEYEDVEDMFIYQGLFTPEENNFEYVSENYNPKENIRGKYPMIYKILLFLTINGFLYVTIKKYWGHLI